MIRPQIIITVFGSLSAFAGVLALIAGLITNTQKFKTWNTERLRRERQLNILADKVEDIQLLIDNQHQIHEIHSKLEKIEQMVDKSLKDNMRQDRQIINSLEERKLLMYGVMAILDWAIDNGANGSAHRAREELSQYKYTMSHKFDEYEYDGGE